MLMLMSAVETGQMSAAETGQMAFFLPPVRENIVKHMLPAATVGKHRKSHIDMLSRSHYFKSIWCEHLVQRIVHTDSFTGTPRWAGWPG